MIRKFRLFLLPVFILLFTLYCTVTALPQARTDSLRDEITRDYHHSTKAQRDLLKIFQDARDERKMHPNLSIRLYQKFYDKSIAAHESYFAATALFEICRVYMDRHLYFPAMECSLRAYQILADNHLEEKSNYFMIGIGNCYFQTGNYLEAEEYFRQAEILFTKNSDFHGQAVALNNIGLVKQKLKQKDSALWYFKRALDRRRKTRQIANIGHSYYYIGSAYFDLGELKEARKYFEMAIPLLNVSSDNIFLRHDYVSTMADAWFELGKLSDTENEHNQALLDFNTALTICDTINEKVKMPDIYIAMGHSYIKTGDLTRALHSYRNALKIADSANIPEMKKTCYESIIQVFIQDPLKDSVSLYFEKYRLINDTIQAQMIKSRFNEISLAIKIRETENETHKLKKNSTLTITFLVTIGVLLLLLILISLFHIRKQRKNAKVAAEEINARKKAEQDLEKLNLELKEINTGKDRFISILSHDLRSPFNALMGFSDLLVEETADKNIPEIRHYSKMVQQIARGTYQLLENLLAWSRLQIGTMPFMPTRLQLYDEVSVVVDTMMVTASRKSIRIRNLVSADAVVQADGNMLQAILRNLIANAVKFTKPEGSIEIRSELKDNYQMVRISDNGIGIIPQISENLFKDGDGMVSTNGTENEKGHGLGLLLCRYMVEKNGGSIALESTSEKGSTFVFTLPAVRN